MHLDHRRSYALDSVGYGERRVGVRSCVQHNAVDGESRLVQLVDDAALVVALEIVDFVLRECLAQLLEVAVEITVSVYLRPKRFRFGPFIMSMFM